VRGESKFFDRQTALRMLTPDIQDDYGLGFALTGERSVWRFGHDGWNYGFVARLRAYRDHSLGLVVMSIRTRANP
jgi:hypothetical protein